MQHILEKMLLLEKDVLFGNSTELKNAILFNEAEVPHYNYVGDSILGYKAHMGAGSILSNVRADKQMVTVSYNDKKIDCNLRKFGAILGDYSEIGCGSVLNPGSIIGRNTRIYPLSSIRGLIPENCIYKDQKNIIKIN